MRCCGWVYPLEEESEEGVPLRAWVEMGGWEGAAVKSKAGKLPSLEVGDARERQRCSRNRGGRPAWTIAERAGGKLQSTGCIDQQIYPQSGAERGGVVDAR